jgi:hypothetical protein
MPCIFCLAVFALFAGAVTELVLDQMEAKLAQIADGPVTRTVDSTSVAVFEAAVTLPGGHGHGIPVTITVYKKHRRIRIQVMTHDLTRAQAEALEDLIARALELTIVDRSDAHDEEKVRAAFGEEELEAELTATERSPQARKDAEPAPAPPKTRPRGQG